MRRRLFTILSALSLLMCVATSIAWIWSHWFQVWREYGNDGSMQYGESFWVINTAAGEITLTRWLFNDFSLDIKVGSMAKQNDALAQKRAQDEWQLAMGMAQLGFPINWRRILRRYGRAFGERDYDRILIMDDMGQVLPFGPGASAPGAVPQFGPQIPGVGQVASGMGAGMQRPASPFGASPNRGLTSMQGLTRNAMAV